MNSLIVFFLPSVLGLKISMHLNKKKTNLENFINYALLVLFSNYLSLIVLKIFNKGEFNLIDYATNNFVFCIKYITIMIIINVILSIIFTIIDKYLIFDIEVENERKSKKRKNSKNN